MKRIALVWLLCVGCGGAADAIEGRWALHADSPTLDGQPATGVPPEIDVTMDLHVAQGNVSGTATTGTETATASGQSYTSTTGKKGCTIILRFTSMTLEPFCESVSDGEMSGNAYLWGTRVPTYRFTARRQ